MYVPQCKDLLSSSWKHSYIFVPQRKVTRPFKSTEDKLSLISLSSGNEDAVANRLSGWIMYEMNRNGQLKYATRKNRRETLSMIKWLKEKGVSFWCSLYLLSSTNVSVNCVNCMQGDGLSVIVQKTLKDTARTEDAAFF